MGGVTIVYVKESFSSSKVNVDKSNVAVTSSSVLKEPSLNVGASLIELIVILKVISWLIDVIEVSVDAVTIILEDP